MKIRKEEPLIKNWKTRCEILSGGRVFPGLMIFLLLVTAAWGQTVYVDRWYRGDLPSDGTPGRPYRWIRVAHDSAPNNARIQMEPAIYPEQMTLSKPLTFVANGGPVTIGISAPVVLTQHNDNNRTGFIQEVQLNTSNVNPQRFGKLFVRPVDGQIYAQPLYLSNVTMPDRRVRNVVYVATMHNTVYAFDADDPAASAPLWVRSNLGPSVSIRDGDLGLPSDYRDITFEGDRRGQGEIGIIGTPVISLDQNALYVVVFTKQGSNIIHRLYALDLTTGATKFGGPRVISGSASGATFNSKRQNQRGALLLANDRVYISFAAYGDKDPYHGWVFAYDAKTLMGTPAVYNATGNGARGGIWQSGQGPAADSDGNIYVMTGNGSFNSNGSQLGDSFVKLQPNLALADWFSPCNNADLDAHDVDLGTGGPLLIPNTGLMIGGGKQGKIYVLNRNNMGRFRGQPCGPGGDQGDSHIVQRFYVRENGHIHSLAYWNGSGGPYAYVWPEGDQLKAFRLAGEQFQFWQSTRPPTEPPEHPGGMLSISANGSLSGTGIVWASLPFRESANTKVVPGILRAYDASDLTRELWDSKQNLGRDDFGYFAKFSFPTIANGKVYLPTFSYYLSVYGLLP